MRKAYRIKDKDGNMLADVISESRYSDGRWDMLCEKLNTSMNVMEAMQLRGPTWQLVDVDTEEHLLARALKQLADAGFTESVVFTRGDRNDEGFTEERVEIAA